MKNSGLLLKVVVVAVVLNISSPMLLTPFATSDEVKPPNGAANLSFKSQVIHMLVHHKQVMFTSSLIVFIVVFLSNFIQKFLKSKLII